MKIFAISVVKNEADVIRYTFITLTLALAKNRRVDALRYLAKALRAGPTVLWRRRFLA